MAESLDCCIVMSVEFITCYVTLYKLEGTNQQKVGQETSEVYYSDGYKRLEEIF